MESREVSDDKNAIKNAVNTQEYCLIVDSDNETGNAGIAGGGTKQSLNASLIISRPLEKASFTSDGDA